MESPAVQTERKLSTPQGFVREDYSPAPLSEDAKTYLIRVPKGFDITNLHGKSFSRSHGKEVHRWDGPGPLSTVFTATPFKSDDIEVLPLTQCGGKLQLGDPVRSLMTVTKSYEADIKPHPDRHSEGGTDGRVAMPAGLRPRFTPFGTGTPVKVPKSLITEKTTHPNKTKESKYPGDCNNNKKETMFSMSDESDLSTPQSHKKHQFNFRTPLKWQPLTPTTSIGASTSPEVMTSTSTAGQKRKRHQEEGEETSVCSSTKKKMKKHKHKQDKDNITKTDPDTSAATEMDDSCLGSSFNASLIGSDTKKKKKKKKRKSSVCEEDSSDLAHTPGGAHNGVDSILSHERLTAMHVDNKGDFGVLESKKERFTNSFETNDSSCYDLPDLETTSSSRSKKKKKKDKK